MVRVHITDAAADDAVELRACNRRNLPVFYELFEYAEFITRADYTVLIARLETKRRPLIGYAISRIENPTREHVISVAIDSNYRGRGIGRQLFDSLVERMSPKVKFLTLNVEQSNESAIGFYEKYGMKKIRELRDYYGLGGHGWCMGKKVDL